MRILMVVIMLMLLNGCAGLGLEKQWTVIPDEVWVSTSHDAEKNGKLDKIVGGIKWKSN